MIDGALVKLAELAALIKSMNQADKEWMITEAKLQLDQLTIPHNGDRHLLTDIEFHGSYLDGWIDYDYTEEDKGAMGSEGQENPDTPAQVDILAIWLHKEGGNGKSAPINVIEWFEDVDLHNFRVDILGERS